VIIQGKQFLLSRIKSRRDFMGDNFHAKSKNSRAWGEEKALRGDADPNRMGRTEPAGFKGWTVPIGTSRESSERDNPFRHEDSTPGGIASRLIEKLLEQRAEVQGRYEIVLKRKAEYEEKLTQIDQELEEARAIAQEIFQIDQLGQTDQG
jgi:hypothetical protein